MLDMCVTVDSFKGKTTNCLSPLEQGHMFLSPITLTRACGCWSIFTSRSQILLHIQRSECLSNSVTQGWWHWAVPGDWIPRSLGICVSLGSQGLLSDGQCINMSYKQETLPSSLSSLLTLAISVLSVVGTTPLQSCSTVRCLWACRHGHKAADERRSGNRCSPPVCTWGYADYRHLKHSILSNSSC